MDDPESQNTQSTESTQPLSQPLDYDVLPSADDIIDILCTLKPTSPAARRIVEAMYEKRPEHVIVTRDSDLPGSAPTGLAIALRFSSELLDHARGFSFGRSVELNEIALDFEGKQKRISQIHFQIYVNSHNVLMLRDTSTNGTVVDKVVVGGKRDESSSNMRTLNFGSTIKIVFPDADDEIRFALEWPIRDQLAKIYAQNFERWIEVVDAAEKQAHLRHLESGSITTRPTGFPGKYINPGKLPRTRSMFQGQPPATDEEYGMHWDGGERYKCIGQIGAGAFATVYQVSDRFSGEVFAVKELEKRRFVKNGLLDHRVDNEMQIMRTLRHPHIVQFIDFVEKPAHLYIVMELIHFGDLQEFIKLHGVLTEDLGRQMTYQIIDALDYLHGMDITHRDIKPENILIAEYDPFTVKLTDFGLSKVVKNGETFLKTFCGTLLYCAPEVFPQYDAHAAGVRSKRSRNERDEHPQIGRRSYGQQIDIWSYGVVLWTALCGITPFEGKADATGRAMFNEIMKTELETWRLRDIAISEEAIDLIVQMLYTNPALRPTEEECFQHAWLAPLIVSEPVMAVGEGAIEQRDPADQLSQLSLKHNKGSESSFEGVFAFEEHVDSESFGSFKAGDQKRQKGESSTIPRNELETRGGRNPVLSNLQFPAPPGPSSEDGDPREVDYKPFGVPGKKRIFSLDGAWDESSNSDSAKDSENDVTQNFSFTNSELGTTLYDSQHADALYPGFVPKHATPSQEGTVNQQRTSSASSLSGAEVMVQNLCVNSPHSSDVSSLNTLFDDEPTTPKQAPLRSEDTTEEDTLITPKQVHFQRYTEDIPNSNSLYYDDYEDDTSKGESAVYSSTSGNIQNHSNRITTPMNVSHSPSTISQLDLNNASDRAQLLPPFAANFERPVTATSNKENEASHKGYAPTSPKATENHPIPSLLSFAKPAPLLGRLVTTPNSYKQITIPLSRRITTWGRHPENTIVYADINDIRVPKLALELWFHARGINELERAGLDWTKMPDLDVVVRTHSRFGIYVNGVLLTEMNEAGTIVFGRLYSGDEVTITGAKGGGEVLKFVCEFLVGKAGVRRGTDNAKFVVCTST